jgi:SAM-dependent methyltransferase
MTIDKTLYARLRGISDKPEPWSAYTAEALWNDSHISSKMLESHLDPVSEPASRPHDFIEASSRWIIGEFRLGPGRRVADFGCGPGLYASRFATAGADVTGIDFSSRSIWYAREQAVKNGLEIRYETENYLERIPEGPFDLITQIYCDFCALNPSQRASLLTSWRSILADDGRILMDVFSQKAYGNRTEDREYAPSLMGGFWSPNPYVGFRHTWKYDEASIVLDKYDIIEADREWAVFNWLQYFDEDGLAAEIEEAGLQILGTYGDVAGVPASPESETLAFVIGKKTPVLRE